MNALNSTANSLFNLLLTPLEAIGPQFAILVVSGIFGVLALVAFKAISKQDAIKGTKDKIKGHLIEIRLYQDDLVVVGKAIAKVLLRNFQYLALNFGPFIPLSIPFVIVASQLVVRYAFDPLEVQAIEAPRLAGAGVEIQVQMASSDRYGDVKGMTLELPAGLTAVSALVRIPSEGRAVQEVIATGAGAGDIIIRYADGREVRKRVVMGDEPERLMQPERTASFFGSWLWPAEDKLATEDSAERVWFVYPERDLGWLPGGPFGVLLSFVLASMVFGVIALKPLGVQI